MTLAACGINHKTTPLAIRERIAIVPDRMPEPLLDLVQNTHVREAAILSTCNRTELYCETDHQQELINWLQAQHLTANLAINDQVYLYSDEAAVRHMLRVASGLDSMVIGEPQILGQMKQAFQTAVCVGTIGPSLQRLFQYVFSTTKKVRAETEIGKSAINIAFAAVNMAKHIFADMKNINALVIGAGKTIELCLRYLTSNDVSSIFIANRSPMRAQTLANKYNAQVIRMADIASQIANVDMIIAATASPMPIVGKDCVERAIKARKHRPIFMVDLAVPRDIEPEIALLDDVYLYSLDDLQAIIVDNLKTRHYAAQRAEQMIDIQVERYMRWCDSLNAVATIRAFRDKIATIRAEEVAHALHALELGTPATEVLTNFARTLTNKIMHEPTVRMRQAGFDGDEDALIWMQELFGL